MQVSKCVGLVLLWIAGLVLVFAGINHNDPYLVPLRGAGNLLLAAISAAVVILLVRGGAWRWRVWTGRLLVVLWCLPPLAMLAAHGVFELRRHRVLQTEPELARSLGQHFIVGYRSFDEIAPLAIYLASREASVMTGQGINIDGGVMMS